MTGSSLFAVGAAVLLLLRPAQEIYRPGDAADGLQITSKLARDLPNEVPRVAFTDVARESGIRFRHFHGSRSTQLPEDMGSGAAWGDFDGDGDPDLYLVNESGPIGADPAGAARSALFRNEGDGTFTDVTDAAGVGAAGIGMGAAWGDFDGDGDLDLFVTRYGTNLLYRNEGQGRFRDVSAETGVGDIVGFWTGSSWADFDRDGDLDLYVCGYVRFRFEPDAAKRTSFQYGAVLPFTLNPSSYEPERNLLYRNDRGRFTEIGATAGVDNPAGRSLAAAWADFDSDGWPDLYVANDISDNAMYRNEGDGTFRDVSHSSWVADYRGAMGLAVGDWENDGDLDIVVTHWIAQENAFYENLHEKMPPSRDEPMHFVDQADRYGLGQIAIDFVGWGAFFFDYDNDGRLDLFVANGSTFPVTDNPSLLVPMRNLLFWNAGSRDGFYEAGQAAGASFLSENVGRGAAPADYDGDGDLDVAVVVNGGPALLLRNESTQPGSWIRLVLRGPRRSPREPGGRATTTFATGARVKVTTGGTTRIREVGGGPSYLSQEPPGEVHFGLGSADRVDRVEIGWPDGGSESFDELPARATVTIVQGEPPRVEANEPTTGRRP